MPVDEEILRVELASLQEGGFDLDIVGFTDEEPEDLLRDPEETRDGLADQDFVPDEQETANRSGRCVDAGHPSSAFDGVTTERLRDAA